MNHGHGCVYCMSHLLAQHEGPVKKIRKSASSTPSSCNQVSLPKLIQQPTTYPHRPNQHTPIPPPHPHSRLFKKIQGKNLFLKSNMQFKQFYGVQNLIYSSSLPSRVVLKNYNTLYCCFMLGPQKILYTILLLHVTYLQNVILILLIKKICCSNCTV